MGPAACEAAVPDLGIHPKFHRLLRPAAREEAVPHLVNLLRDKNIHRHPKVRGKVVRTLAEIGPAAVGAVPELVNQLGDTNLDQMFRLQVVLAFGAMGPAAVEAMPELVNLLRDKNLDRGFRSQVVRTLQKIRLAVHEEAVPELVNQLGDTYLDPVPELVNLLRDTKLDPAVGSFVAWTLGEMGPAAFAALPDLVNLLPETELDPAVRSAVAWAVTQIGTVPENLNQLPAVEGAVPEFVNLLKDTKLDPGLCRSLARTLGKFAPENTAEEMLKKLQDPHLELKERVHLASVFPQMGPRVAGAVPQLANLLRDTDLDLKVRQSLARALGEMEPAAVSKGQLVDLLQDSNVDSELRRSLASRFGLFGLESVPLLMELLADPSLNQDHSLLTEALKRIIDVIDGRKWITSMPEKTLGATVSQLNHANSEVQDIVRPFINKIGGPQLAKAQGERRSDLDQKVYHGTGEPSSPAESTSESRSA